jgi:peptidoglycan/LPS O-acetylase OafA/YrhL
VGEFCFVFQILNLIPWRQSWLNPLGEYSYGIYLTHMNVLRALLTIFVPVVSSYWVRFAVVIVITCFLGGCFEFGYNWLQQRFEKKKLTSHPKK